MQNNKNLFYYGLRAKIKMFFGKAMIVIGVIISLILQLSYFNSLISFIVLFTFIGLGIYLIITARAQRFDYQRQSGNIIHKGDWN